MSGGEENTPDAEPSFGDNSEDLGDFGGGSEDGGDKPFEDEPFDAGVEADEDSDPKKFIQQLAGKLGTTMRKYSETQGQPDFELEKFAVNSVVSATHTGDMDGQDQNEIIKKIKTAGQGDENSEPTDNPDEPTNDKEDSFSGDEALPNDADVEENMIVDGIEPEAKDPMGEMYVGYLKDYGTEQPFTINTQDGPKKFQYVWAEYPNGKHDIAVYSFSGDVTYGYKWFRKTFLNITENSEDGVVIEYEQNIAENLPIGENYSTFVEKIIMDKFNKANFLTETVEEVFSLLGNSTSDNGEPEIETPVKEPDTKTKEPDSQPTRRNKPWKVPRIKENPDPKASIK
jgi:hypothetical protein